MGSPLQNSKTVVPYSRELKAFRTTRVQTCVEWRTRIAGATEGLANQGPEPAPLAGLEGSCGKGSEGKIKVRVGRIVVIEKGWSARNP